MLEGWHGDEYFVLFEAQGPSLQDAYGLTEALPGYRLLGLRGWDDFIVQDSAGSTFTVPTVPLDTEHLAPFESVDAMKALTADPRLTGRIKWYLKPIVLGGDPSRDANIAWVSVAEHAQLVRFWNKMYRDLKSKTARR